MSDRYELNYNGEIVQGSRQLCKDKDTLIQNAFMQYGRIVDVMASDGPYMKLKISKQGASDIVVNVFSGNIRDESRSPYEKKIQLSKKDPRNLRDENTIILGVYVFNENDGLKDAVFVSYAIDRSISYDTNPSLRGVMVNGVLFNAKNKGFYHDASKNIIGFRPEFLYYFLDNYKKLHYKDNNVYKLGESTNSSICIGENNLLYGVPGCGKSYYVEKIMCQDIEDDNKLRVTFHPDYTYGDFIGQLLPSVNEDDGRITYAFKKGPFTSILQKACDPRNKKKHFVLIIEEINRGNSAAIFGDIFQLLDRKNGRSEYGITNEDILHELLEVGYEDGKIYIPSNLSIYATMNTSDQNVFVLDTAFKRRWKEQQIENEINNCDYKDSIVFDNITWENFFHVINDRIADLVSQQICEEDKMLGAFFVKEDEVKDKEVFASKVIAYLWNDVVKYHRSEIFHVDDYKTFSEIKREYITGEPLKIFNQNKVDFESKILTIETEVGE